jgi:creatinine amidohydrolase
MPAPLPSLLLPAAINTGPWVAGYSLDALRQRLTRERVVLPVCALGTSAATLAALGPLVLPPLYREAFASDPALETEMIAQIRRCFPFFEGTQARRTWQGELEVIDVPSGATTSLPRAPRVLAFGVDTTIEQHGPHLPLATDTIQTYAVLERLAATIEGVAIGPPLDYGHLTWGLPFGASIDLTPPLLARYVAGFVAALVGHCAPQALYVADVHGSIIHRQTIESTLARQHGVRAAFRWLHEPLAEFSSQRDDMHAGGVETILVHHIDPAFVDSAWWPAHAAEIAAREMTVAHAAVLSRDMPRFVAHVETSSPNGVIGKIANASTLDAAALFSRMVEMGRADIQCLLR